MAHIILTGATGLVGSAVLAHALTSPSVGRVSILSRRPVKLAENQPKARVIIHKDFVNYPPELLDELKGASACIWAQGISSRGMKEDEYTAITVTYPLAAANAFASLSDHVNFVYVSGEGADMSGNASMMFGRVKGRAERELLELQAKYPSLSVYNARPGGVNPQGHYIADRKPGWHDRVVGTGLGSLMEVVWTNMTIPTRKLGVALVALAVGDGKPIAAGVGIEEDGRLLRNSALRRLAS